MGILKAIGDFLFGKDPNIFDSKGRVHHQFPDEKWKKWDARIKNNPEYDWHKHGAAERVAQAPSSAQKNKNG